MSHPEGDTPASGLGEDQDSGGDTGPPAEAVMEEREEKGGGDCPSKAKEGSGSGDEENCLYQLKWVEWKGGFTPIVTQNLNGPCPLLALCNVLLLSGRMQLPTGETAVTSGHLLDLLGASIIENFPQNMSEGERANYEQNVQDAMSSFPKLQTGLDVNVRFDGVRGFEFTNETVIFDLLGVHLYHGWLPDPQDKPTWECVQGNSYNRLVELVVAGQGESDPSMQHRALISKQFLESSANQLTYCGMYELGAAMGESELAVFFRNNHFSTILKRGDALLLLVTDHGFVNELGHVWQTLSSTDGDEIFLDGNFRLSEWSEAQQQREREQAGPDIHISHPHSSHPEHISNVSHLHPPQDYQTALSLQQEEYAEGGEEKATKPPIYSSAGPNSASEYEKASQEERRRRGKETGSVCSLS